MKKIMMSIFAGILSISCMTLPIEGKTRCSSEVSRAADDFMMVINMMKQQAVIMSFYLMKMHM